MYQLGPLPSLTLPVSLHHHLPLAHLSVHGVRLGTHRGCVTDSDLPSHKLIVVGFGLWLHCVSIHTILSLT